MPTRTAPATRPMAAIPLDTAQVTLVDHGSGAGFGLIVDGRPVPNVMLLPAGPGPAALAGPYNVIVGGVFYLTVSQEEAMRWAPVLARWSETITGSTNGHIAAGNGAAKPVARTRAATGRGMARTPTAPKAAAAPTPNARATATKNPTPLPRTSRARAAPKK